MRKALGASFRRLSTVLAPLAACIGILACSAATDADPLQKAKALEASKDLKGAMVTLKAALQRQPESSTLRSELGRVLLASGSPGLAVLELKKALELGAPKDVGVPLLVTALSLSGKAAEATGSFAKEQLGSDSARAELQIALAVAWALQGNTEELKTSVGRAMTLDPQNPQGRLMQAQLLVGAGKVDEAWALNEATLAAKPDHAGSLHFKGLLLRHARRDLKAAMESQQAALKVEPTMLRAHTEILSMMFEAGDRTGMRKQIGDLQKALPNNLDTHLFRAQIEFLDGKYPVARDLVQQLLKAKKPDPRVQILAARVEYMTGGYSLAEKYLEQVLTEYPALEGPRQMLAGSQLRAGQPDKAIRTLQPLLKLAKPDPSVFGIAAEAYLQLGDLAKAQDAFTAAATSQPKDPKVRSALALIQIAKGKKEEGLAELESVAKADSGTFADLALISTLLRQGALDRALAAVSQLEKKDAKRPLFAHLRGQILQRQRQEDAAKKSFAQALEIDPGYFPSAFALGSMHMNANDLKSAKAIFENLLKKDPGSFRGMLALADIKARAKDAPETVVALLSEAVKRHPTQVAARSALIEYHLRQKNLKAALEAAQDASTALSDNPTVLEYLARTQSANKEFQQALSTYRKLANAAPNSALPHLRMAEVLAAKGDKPAAIASLRRAIDIQPGASGAQSTLAQYLLDERRLAEAMTVAKELQKSRPKDGFGHLVEADIHIRQKDWASAASALRSSLSRSATSEATIKLHIALLQLGKASEADKLAGDWRQRFPKDVAFLAYQGSDAMSKKDWPRAEAVYVEALKIAPNLVSANNNMAWALMHQNKPGALEFAERADRGAPDSPAIMDTLASALAHEGQVQKALDMQRKVVAMAPQLLEARLTLARIALKADDRKLARAELEKLAYEGSKFAQQDEVARLLASLK